MSADSFPTPHLALRSTAKDEIERVRGFAVEQARAATDLLPDLTSALRVTTDLAGRVSVLMALHRELVQWRHALAVRTNRRLGRGLPHDADRFVTSMSEGGPNFDRIGYAGRLREDSTWDSVSRTYRGGNDTPAFRIALAYGDLAQARFGFEDNDGEILRNQVNLPDGTRIAGNSLVRGAAAEHIAAELVARIARRGADTSRIETGGNPIFVVTADDENRARMFQAAMAVLAEAGPGDVPAWQAARYLLYQSPMTKKGSDAVTRTFLVTVGTVLFGRPPVLEHDVDLRCVVVGQHVATVMPHDQEPCPVGDVSV